MSNSGDQDYPLPEWYNGGESSAPFPVQATHFAPSPGQSPHPWRRTIPYNTGTFANPTSTNNLGSVGPPPPPQQGGGSGYNPPPFRQIFSASIKRLFSKRLAQADSEIVGVERETCGPGRSRFTITFETSDGI